MSEGQFLKERKPWYLEQPNFFDALTHDQQSVIEKAATVKRFSRGDLICNLDDTCEYIYILRKGSTKVFLLTIDGKEIILAIRRPGNIIGMTAIFSWQKRVSYVAALEDVELFSIRTGDMREFVLSHMEVATLIIKILSIRLHQARMIIEDLSTKNVKERLVKFLIDLSEDVGEVSKEGIVIHTNLTHEQISQIVASSRQTVTLILNDLEAEQLIRKGRKKIVIPDRAKLKGLLV